MESAFDLFYRKLYTKVFPDYYVVLRKAIGDCKSVLDLGCGKMSLLRFFPATMYREGVESYEPYLEESRIRGIHNKYHKMNVMDIENHFQENGFECVYAGDVIEHLEKADGFKLISMMERIASKRVIIYTPNGFLPLGTRDGNELYIHKSGWNVDEMEDMGFRVIGLSGWKILRGDDTGIRFRPKFFWRIISDLTQVFTKKRSLYAKQILCVKDVR